MRRTSPARCPAGPARRHRACPAWSGSTARAATSSSWTSSCPLTSRPATCSPCRVRAPTAGPCPASTTTPHGLRWSPCGTVAHGSWSAARRSTTCWPWTSGDRLRDQISKHLRPDGWTNGRIDAVTEPRPDEPLRVALLGCGVVGSAVARLLTQHRDDLAARVGRPMDIVGIAVRRAGRDRSDLGLDPALFTTDAEDLVTRADVVVEVIGGIEPARSLILRAMKHGASVVTANKALLAQDGPTLYAAAQDAGVDLYYEAAVAGAIPLLRPLRESLSGADVHREGITEVTAADVAAAKEMDSVVKLLAICERTDEGVSVRVHPAMIPRSHPLAGVREAFNAVFVEADAAGQLMFYGRGAGGDPTASAVLGDVVAVARHRIGGGRGPGESSYADLPVLEMGQAMTRYHISLEVADRPGVLAQVATAFAEHGVSIETVRQHLVRDDETGQARANLIVVTHTAPDAALSATVDALAKLPTVDEVTSVMRVEGS